MRKLSAVLVILSALWLAGLSAIGPSIHPTVPGTGNAWDPVGPGLPISAFGDDAGGGHE